MGYFGALQISDCTFNLIYTVNLIYRFPACLIYNCCVAWIVITVALISNFSRHSGLWILMESLHSRYLHVPQIISIVTHYPLMSGLWLSWYSTLILRWQEFLNA